jgi:hypothetical protein
LSAEPFEIISCFEQLESIKAEKINDKCSNLISTIFKYLVQ